MLDQKIFISHASKNFNLADDIRARLESLGLTCWIAPRDIAPGTSYGQEITQSIERCAAVVLVLTEAANVSRAVANELEMAFRFQKVIIPVRAQPVKPSSSLAFFLNNTQWVDAFHSPLKYRVHEIARILTAVLSGQPPPVAAPESATIWGSLERYLERIIRHRFLTIAFLVFVIGSLLGLNLLISNKINSRINDEQTSVNKDPTTFGLVNLDMDPNVTDSIQELSLRATIYMNLREPSKANVKWQAYSRDSVSGKNVALDTSSLTMFHSPGVKILVFNVPKETDGLIFCMTGVHPSLGEPYAAKWKFVLRPESVDHVIHRSGIDFIKNVPSEPCQ